jgi:hypothetical protein
VRRAATQEQGDLFGTLPLPALGTVAILRLEDWQRITGGAGAVVVSPPPRRHPGIRPKHAALRSLVEDWLRGQGPASSYSADTMRDAQGRVTSTTVEIVARAIEAPSSLTLHGCKTAVGEVMAALGWERNYLTVDGGGRKRFYFAPAAWLKG